MFSDLQEALSVEFWGVPLRTLALSALIIIASILFKTVVTDIVFVWLRAMIAKHEAAWKNKLILALHKPSAALVLALGVFAATRVLPLQGELEKGVLAVLKCVLTSIVFWGVIKALNVAAEVITEHGKTRGLSIATFVPLFKKILIVIVAVIALIMIFDMLGFSVSSIIAALGIGGAALAFASQSTIANLYSSIAIAMDRPFKVGDAVKVGAVEGTVESIGLRSTQIRTFTKTLVSIPNNTIANEAIDNYSLMPQRRILALIGLTYGTTQAQIEAIIADIKKLMESMTGELARDPQQAHLAAFGDSAINVEIVCFTGSADFHEFLRIRQKLYFGIMQIVEKNGSAFAFPTRTVHLSKQS